MFGCLLTIYLSYGNVWIWDLRVLSTAGRWVHPWSTVCAGLPVVKQSRIIHGANEKRRKERKLQQLGYLNLSSKEGICQNLNKNCPSLMSPIQWWWLPKAEATLGWRDMNTKGSCLLCKALTPVTKLPMYLHLTHVTCLLPVLAERVV